MVTAKPVRYACCAKCLGQKNAALWAALITMCKFTIPLSSYPLPLPSIHQPLRVALSQLHAHIKQR